MTAREFLNRPFILNNKINDKKIKLGFYRELSCYRATNRNAVQI